MYVCVCVCACVRVQLLLLLCLLLGMAGVTQEGGERQQYLYISFHSPQCATSVGDEVVVGTVEEGISHRRQGSGVMGTLVVGWCG